MPFTMKLKFDQATQQIENSVSIAIRMMMEDIHSMANPITPKRLPPVGGNLRTSVTKQMPNKLTGVMIWHAPYAEYQERGFTTGPVRHYSTPGTHAHFVEESLEKAKLKLPQYIRMGGLI